MSEEKDNSSLPLLLAISAAVLLTVGVGWYLLDDDYTTPPETPELNAKSSPDESGDKAADGLIEQPVVGEEPAANSVEELMVEAQVAPAASRLDTNLRKARMAAEAEILAYPTNQSALFYYNQILETDPDHAIARAELESVLVRIGQTATAHMVAEEFADAYDLAVLVSRRHPDDALVQEVTQELDRLTNEFVEQAIVFTQDGDDDEAITALLTAEGLPGRNPEYFAAVRESITNIQDSRIAAEQSRLEIDRLARVKATTAWVDKVRGAIFTGRLISPAGESAVDYLAERESPASQKTQLTEELASALFAECNAKLDSSNLSEADQLLRALTEFTGENPDTLALRDTLESAFVRDESNKFLPMEEFVRLKVVPARYPRRAEIRNLSGWVEVVFTVSTSGETTDIEVQNADPAEIFDDAAMAAVEQWTFEPRVFRGQTINQRTGARLAFQIR